MDSKHQKKRKRKTSSKCLSKLIPRIALTSSLAKAQKQKQLMLLMSISKLPISLIRNTKCARTYTALSMTGTTSCRTQNPGQRYKRNISVKPKRFTRRQSRKMWSRSMLKPILKHRWRMPKRTLVPPTQKLEERASSDCQLHQNLRIYFLPIKTRWSDWLKVVHLWRTQSTQSTNCSSTHPWSVSRWPFSSTRLRGTSPMRTNLRQFWLPPQILRCRRLRNQRRLWRRRLNRC